MKKLLFALTTTGLLAVIFFCFSQSVYSQTKENSFVADKEGIDRFESNYLSQVRELMEAYGCSDSGITMTKVFTEDGGRSYEVQIHHRNLSYLDEVRVADLKTELELLTAPWDNLEFQYEFTSSNSL